MQSPFLEILKLLTESPGNLVYHLVLAFSILSSLQAAQVARRGATRASATRLVVGLGILLLAQIALYITSGLAWQQILDERAVLPPLDRAVFLLSLLWIVWLWNFLTRARLGDLVTGIFSLGIVVFFLYSYSSWGPQSSSAFFNLSWLDMAWMYASIFLGLLGLVLLLATRPAGWGFGFGTIALLVGGCVAHLLLSFSDQNLSPYLRLAQMAAFPLLPTLLHRLAPAEHSAEPAASARPAQAGPFPSYPAERRRYSADPRAIHHWLSLLNTTEPARVPAALVEALAHTLLADICYYVTLPAAGRVVFQTGYDLIREQALDEVVIEPARIPRVSAFLQRGKPLRITPQDAQPSDLAVISAALGLSSLNDLLMIPLALRDQPQGALVFLSPYANRAWSADDQNFFGADMEIIAAVLKRARESAAVASLPAAAAPAVDPENNLWKAQLDQLREENRLLLQEISEQRLNATAARPPYSDDLNALIMLQQETQAQIGQLQAENERLQGALKGVPAQQYAAEASMRLESELRATLQDLAMLQNQLAEANARILILEHNLRSVDRPGDETSEVVASLVQETRQPMSSIIGYTELLLSESVGILVPTQRKFVERIRSSNERLRSILDDLLRISALRDSLPELLPGRLDLSSIVDSAIASTSAQLREKNIALRVDLPEENPHFLGDRDAIQQIIVHLLQNAGFVTPAENSITLRARMQRDPEQSGEYLLLQVVDRGGGIPTEDLSRVFARRYRADSPLIPGVGDTSVGLSIAKTLVDVQGGRIWVDSVPGESTTFSALLPVQTNGAQSESA